MHAVRLSRVFVDFVPAFLVVAGLALLLFLTGCGACEHADDARALRRAVGTVADAVLEGQARQLSPAELAALNNAAEEAERLAGRLEEVTR